MEASRDIVYLKHVQDAISKIQEYADRGGKQTFDQDTAIQDAIVRQIEIIGEATRNISHQTREKYSHVPWKEMSGMRDKLIHDYMGVDLERVWLVVTEDIPLLSKELEDIIADFPLLPV